MAPVGSRMMASPTIRTYIADAVALARYFEDTLPPKANGAFLEAEEKVKPRS
jgi:hypothetical protein